MEFINLSNIPFPEISPNPNFEKEIKDPLYEKREAIKKILQRFNKSADFPCLGDFGDFGDFGEVGIEVRVSGVCSSISSFSLSDPSIAKAFAPGVNVVDWLSLEVLVLLGGDFGASSSGVADIFLFLLPVADCSESLAKRKVCARERRDKLNIKR